MALKIKKGETLFSLIKSICLSTYNVSNMDYRTESRRRPNSLIKIKRLLWIQSVRKRLASARLIEQFCERAKQNSQ
jgi:hypothetical protein